MQNWVLPALENPEVPGLGGRRGQGLWAEAVLSSHLLASMLDKAGVVVAEATDPRASSLLRALVLISPTERGAGIPRAVQGLGQSTQRPSPCLGEAVGCGDTCPPASLLQ